MAFRLSPKFWVSLLGAVFVAAGLLLGGSTGGILILIGGFIILLSLVFRGI